MSFFTKIFGDSNPQHEDSKIEWNALNAPVQLDEIIQESFENPVFIFKHSTRCNISRMALKQFELNYEISPKIKAYYLDLLNFRPISTEIAGRFNVVHQSPQILLIKDGKCIYTASHSDIDASDLALKI